MTEMEQMVQNLARAIMDARMAQFESRLSGIEEGTVKDKEDLLFRAKCPHCKSVLNRCHGEPDKAWCERCHNLYTFTLKRL